MVKKPQFKLTAEEKARWAPMLRTVWDAIGYDCLQCSGSDSMSRAEVVEMVCDADRPCFNSKMTKEEYRVLCDLYDTPAFKRWIAKDVFPSKWYGY